MDIDRKTYSLPSNQYVPAAVKKEQLVLHFTAGSTVQGAVQGWINTPERVATAYVVDRDGRVYETFSPDCWAYHLGVKGALSPVVEKRSIGIEMVNVGPLKMDAARTKLCWWPRNWSETWCRAYESELYRDVVNEYRGFRYYAVFAAAQLITVRTLCQVLCQRFEIPFAIAPEEKRSMFDPNFFVSFSGIATHANYRLDKEDVGPAFNWDALIAGSDQGDGRDASAIQREGPQAEA